MRVWRRLRRGCVVGLVLVHAIGCGARSAPIGNATAGGQGAEAARGRATTAATGTRVLAFQIDDGDIHNYFFQRGAVAAHVLCTASSEPRLVVAFPAGNTGIGVWFEPVERGSSLHVEGALEPIDRSDAMRGVRGELRASVPLLRTKRVVLGGVSSLRGWSPEGVTLPRIRTTVDAGPPVALRRTTMDGRHHIELTLEPLAGTTVSVSENEVVTIEAPSGDLRVRMTATTDEPALTPVSRTSLVTHEVAASGGRTLDVLEFLSYREALLAGSWRFLSYFGRDTLLSLRMLMPVLQPDAIEAGLSAVIERLAPDGDVAHHEMTGDFAALVNSEDHPPPADLQTPRREYMMIDDDFMLAPVLATYALDTPAGRERMRAFMARRTSSGRTYAEAVRANLALVIHRAEPYAAAPGPRTLVELKQGIAWGDWRDSPEGLGSGRYPFDVNAALVPAALRAASRLYATGALGADRVAAAHAEELATAWQTAADRFRVEVPLALAHRRIVAYARAQGIDPAPALASLPSEQPVVLRAISLDAMGEPVLVMSSDDGFALLFDDPPAPYLEEVATRITRPFPAGLMTPIGVVVANAALAPNARIRAAFTRAHYHGTVVWSWQQAMLAAGLHRQLARSNLPQRTRAALVEAERKLWDVIDATAERRSAELWSWAPDAGRMRLVPFGQESGHVDESNAAQLWSTVFLAVRRPSSLVSTTRATAR